MRDHGLRSVARTLRRDATPAERLLWRALRRDALGVTFRRQHPIPPYVADFACLDAMLVVEVDGETHTDQADVERDAVLRASGWLVLRFWNNEVMGNLEGVVLRIAEAVEARRGVARRIPPP